MHLSTTSISRLLPEPSLPSFPRPPLEKNPRPGTNHRLEVRTQLGARSHTHTHGQGLNQSKIEAAVSLHDVPTQVSSEIFSVLIKDINLP